jgi:hypothetical protein
MMILSEMNKSQSLVWWYMLVNPALGRPGQEDCKFKISLSYIVRACLKKERKEGKKEKKEKKRTGLLFVPTTGRNQG